MADFVLTGFGDEIAPDLDTQLAVMDSLGIHHIELRGIDGRNIVSYTPEEARELSARLRDRGFSVSALGSPIGKSDIGQDFEATRADLARMLEVARVLGTKYIRLFSFFVPQGEADAHADEVLSRVQQMKQLAHGSGVVLLHENEREIYGDTIDRCRRLAELCDEDFQLIFDASNFVQTGEDAWAAWLALRGQVVYLHMKDSVYGGGANARDMGFENVSDNHRPVGEGDGHIERILRDMAARGFSGYLSLEPHLVNVTSLPGTPEDKWRLAAGALSGMVKRVLG